MKVLVTGSSGMLGQDLCPVFEQAGFEVLKTNRKNFDVEDFKAVQGFLQENKPDVIIHLAAYTKVDLAEQEKNAALNINFKASENLAIAANKINAKLVYVSTDYVFDGLAQAPYETYSETNPVNHYGLTKLMGEKAVMKNTEKFYIARTSWLYGPLGKNFVDTMLKLAAQNKSIKVVNDQTGTPTYTVDLAKGILEILKMPYGIYHLSGEGETTWYGFAKEIFKMKNIKADFAPVSSKEYVTPAKRPVYSVLKNSIEMRNWQEGLKDYLYRI